MSKSFRRKSGLWKFLEESGVLQTGDEKLIEEAKTEYKRLYMRKYRKEKRKKKPEVTITMDKEEWLRLTHGAQQHYYSIPEFVKLAALSYLNQAYLVPKKEPVSQLEQRLRLCQTDIRMITKHLGKLNQHNLKQAYFALANRIQHLEEFISQTFRHPPKIK